MFYTNSVLMVLIVGYFTLSAGAGKIIINSRLMGLGKFPAVYIKL